MTADTMNSMQRTLTTLGQQEPDRVPLFLLTTLHGAREVGLSIEEYFSQPGNVIEGQMRLLKKYRSDSLYAFFHASIETEAWGGDYPVFSGWATFVRSSDYYQSRGYRSSNDAISDGVHQPD